MSENTPFAMSEEDEAAFAEMEQADGATVPKPQPEETEQAQGTEQAQAEDPKTRTVPHQALHAEREEHKRTKAQLREAMEKITRFDERLNVIMSLQRPQGDAERPAPSPEDDIFGATRHAMERVESVQQRLDRMESERRAQDEQSRVLTAYRSAAQQFAAQEPTFGDAYSFLIQQRDAELQAAGVVDAAARIQAIQRDEMQVAIDAMRNGQNPAERILAIAKARGFAPKTKQDASAESVERTAAAQSRTKSLSQAGGAAAASEMTAEKLLAMSNEEFEAWTSKNPAKFKKLMGG